MKTIFISVSLAILVAMIRPLSLIAEDRLSGPVEAKVLSIIDGDTIKVDAHTWLGQRNEVYVRIRGIDAPELHPPHCGSEEFIGNEAKIQLMDLVQGKNVTLFNIEYDKYGNRIVADVVTTDKIDIGKYLIEHGLAKPWDNKDLKPNWC